MAWWQSYVVVSWALAPVLLFVYWQLDRSSTRVAFVIRNHPLSGFMLDRQKWWMWDHWRFPEQSKYEIRNGKNKLIYKYRVPFIDGRGENTRIFDPNSIPLVFDLIDEKHPDELVTSASIIGIEAYNQSTYMFARSMPNSDMLMRNIPWLLVLGGCFVGVFLGAGRIAEMVGIQ